MSDGIWALVAGSMGASASAPAQSASSAQRGAETSGLDNGLGKEAFMQLLMAQMQAQDPLNPMDGQDFFGQLAQLSLLEQMWQMNDSMTAMMQEQQMLQAGALIGKTVDVTSEDGTSFSGVVAGVRILNKEAFLDVGGSQVPLEQVTGIRGTSDEGIGNRE